MRFALLLTFLSVQGFILGLTKTLRSSLNKVHEIVKEFKGPAVGKLSLSDVNELKAWADKYSKALSDADKGDGHADKIWEDFESNFLVYRKEIDDLKVGDEWTHKKSAELKFMRNWPSTLSKISATSNALVLGVAASAVAALGFGAYKLGDHVTNGGKEKEEPLAAQ